MKRLLLAAAAVMLATASAFAQGDINFANFVTTPAIDAPVLGVGGARLNGSQFKAQLYAGANASSLAAVGPVVSFLAGGGAGYWSGVTVGVTFGSAANPASVQVRAWDSNTGATWEAASIKGESAILSVVPTVAPASPAALAGLTSFSLVPEPSTIALAILGAGAMLIARRRK